MNRFGKMKVTFICFSCSIICTIGSICCGGIFISNCLKELFFGWADFVGCGRGGSGGGNGGGGGGGNSGEEHGILASIELALSWTLSSEILFWCCCSWNVLLLWSALSSSNSNVSFSTCNSNLFFSSDNFELLQFIIRWIIHRCNCLDFWFVHLSIRPSVLPLNHKNL